MARSMTLNVRVGGALGEFVAANVGDDGAYENVSEYVRDLIRRDMARADAESFERQGPLVMSVFASADAQEGALAFAEKRPPAWRGK